MSGIKRFAGRFAMGAVLASSLVGGMLALSTGTASAAPKHDFGSVVNQRLDTTYVFLDQDERDRPFFRGNTMLRGELPPQLRLNNLPRFNGRPDRG
jgi:hypothetical protein